MRKVGFENLTLTGHTEEKRSRWNYGIKKQANFVNK